MRNAASSALAVTAGVRLLLFVGLGGQAVAKKLLAATPAPPSCTINGHVS
jgi:hypothetical protein